MVYTENSAHFLTKETDTKESVLFQQNLDHDHPLLTWFSDQDEWEGWEKRADPVLHIDLTKIADLLLVAPLSANTMAKFSHGLADNLLSSVFRAWNFNQKPCIVAPAMNTQMYQSPITHF